MPLTEKQRTQTAERQRRFRERQAARDKATESAGLPAPRQISTMPSTARWNALLEAGRGKIEQLRDEMQEYFDERTEEWQESDRGTEMQERLERLEEALTALEA